MRALIADDEAPARAKLRRLLTSAPDVTIVGEAGSGREAVAAIKRSKPDLVFLDIQMPGLDGLAVADTVLGDGADRNVYIVFVTADDRHAVRAFEVGAVDYLLKPFTAERFARVLDRARDRIGDPHPERVEETSSTLRRLLVSDNGRVAMVPVEQIDWFEAEGNYVTLHAKGGCHRLRTTLSALSARLDPSMFLRISRSVVARIDAMRTIEEWSHGDCRVVMTDGTELTWSRRYRAAAESAFGVQG